jgi:hypothetical protein
LAFFEPSTLPGKSAFPRSERLLLYLCSSIRGDKQAIAWLWLTFLVTALLADDCVDGSGIEGCIFGCGLEEDHQSVAFRQERNVGWFPKEVFMMRRMSLF